MKPQKCACSAFLRKMRIFPEHHLIHKKQPFKIIAQFKVKKCTLNHRVYFDYQKKNHQKESNLNKIIKCVWAVGGERGESRFHIANLNFVKIPARGRKGKDYAKFST
jgi:hypothetical protein